MQTEGFLRDFSRPKCAASAAAETMLPERARTESTAASSLEWQQHSDGRERVTWRKDMRADQDGDRSGCYSGEVPSAAVCRLVVSETRLQSPGPGRRTAPSPKSADGAFIGHKDGALLLACSLFPTSTISSSCPSSPPEVAVPSFVTVMLADWIGCTDQNAERALASGSNGEGRLTRLTDT